MAVIPIWLLNAAPEGHGIGDRMERFPKSAEARMFSKATGTFKSPKRKCRDASEHIGRPPSWAWALLLGSKRS